MLPGALVNVSQLQIGWHLWEGGGFLALAASLGVNAPMTGSFRNHGVLGLSRETEPIGYISYTYI